MHICSTDASEDHRIVRGPSTQKDGSADKAEHRDRVQGAKLDAGSGKVLADKTGD